MSLLRGEASGVELVCDGDQRFSGEYLIVNLSDELGFLRLDGIPPIRAFDIAERDRTVHLAGLGVVPHTAPDVLGHVLGVELIDVHHRAEGEAAGCGVPKLLLGIERPDAEQVQLCFVLKSLQHVPGDTVALVGDDDTELLLLRVPHHLLELRPLVRSAGEGLVRIHPDHL